MIQKPKPETKSVLLMSEGDWKIHPHTYTSTLECTLPGPNGGDAFEFMFKCSVTGIERRYGVVGLDTDVPDDLEEN